MQLCPQCNAQSWVVDTRNHGEYIRRRYRCDGSEEHRFTTREILLAELPKPEIVREEIQVARAALQAALREIKKALPRKAAA